MNRVFNGATRALTDQTVILEQLSPDGPECRITLQGNKTLPNEWAAYAREHGLAMEDKTTDRDRKASLRVIELRRVRAKHS